MTAGHEDFRITKTKQSLVDAFTALITEKKFENITVNELCERADVRRATFYKHFDDKYNFLSYAIKTYRDKFDTNIWGKRAPEPTKDYYVKYAETMISFFESMPELVSSIISSSAYHIILNSMVEQDTVERLKSSVRGGMVLRASIENVSAMLTGGITYIITRWLTNHQELTKEEIVEEISALIDGVIGDGEL